MSDALYGIGGTIIGTCLGFLLNRIATADNEKRFKNQEFERIRTRIATTTINNQLDTRLLELKEFIHANNSYLNKGNWRAFFHQWLMNPMIDEPMNAVGRWNDEKREEMIKELFNLNF